MQMFQHGRTYLSIDFDLAYHILENYQHMYILYVFNVELHSCPEGNQTRQFMTICIHSDGSSRQT